MRILHFSDLHIGVENYGRTDPNTGLSTRLGDFLGALDEVVEYALRLRRLSTAGIPSFLLAGNHDLPAAAARANAVEIFSTLEVPNVHVGARLANHTVPTPAGPLQVLAVPWPSRGAMLARDESRGLSIEQIRQEIERRMTDAIAQRAQELNPDLPAILAGHVTVNGATVGSERSMMLGNDHVLNVSAVQQPQLEYVALGHIHKHQVLRLPATNGSDAIGPGVAYSGSPQRVDFSEEADDKPTEFITRAIARHSIAGAIARLRIRLSGEQSARVRDADLRPSLSAAHYVASISREITDQTRRRLAAEPSDLQPLAALRLYLENQGVNPQRQRVMLERAEELLASVDTDE